MRVCFGHLWIYNDHQWYTSVYAGSEHTRTHLGVVPKPSSKNSVSGFVENSWALLKPASRTFRARPAQGFAQEKLFYSGWYLLLLVLSLLLLLLLSLLLLLLLLFIIITTIIIYYIIISIFYLITIYCSIVSNYMYIYILL